MPSLRLKLPLRRKEQIRPSHCLNCGAAVASDHIFCGHCGQENEPSPVSFVALLREGWEEFVKIDGQLLRTLYLLLFRPGFLSGEYVIGRRAAYLSPFKMYITVSALFFLVFSLLIPFDRLSNLENQAQQVDAKVTAAQKETANSPKSDNGNNDNASLHIKVNNRDGVEGPAQTWKRMRSSPMSFFGMHVALDSLPDTVSIYREQQDKLPRGQRDRATVHFLTERLIRLRNDPGDALKNLLSTGLPLLMLVHLPLFAVWMCLLYVRQRRLYVEHLIFLLHTHTFFFLLFGAVLTADTMAHSFGRTLSMFETSSTPWLALTGTVALYNLLALRRFYKQGWGKTLFKAWFLLNGYFVLFSISIGLSLLGAILWTVFAPG